MSAPGYGTVRARLRNVANSAADGPFLTLLGGDVEPLTYGELMEHAEQFGRRLCALPAVAPGATVVIVLPHGLDLYVAITGTLLANCVPALFAFPSIKHSTDAWFASLSDLVDIADPAVIVARQALADQIDDHLGAVGHTVPLLSPDGGSVDVPGATSKATEGPPPAGADPADEAAVLQFSSGTTGLKKGVRLSHRQLLSQVDRYAAAIQLDPGQDVICSWLPLYHDMGFIACCLMPLLTGTPLVAMSPFEWVRRPQMLLQAIGDHRGTLTWAPNFSLLFMADAVPKAADVGLDLSSLRGLINCSEPLTAAALQAFDERFAGVGWRPACHAASYALAENTFAVTSGGFGAPLGRVRRGDRTLMSSGAMLTDTEVHIVDGEITVRSPSLFGGYHGVGAQQARFDDGFYATGDMGFVEDGELYVTGRKNDLLVLRGQNHFPQDIEQTVSDIEGVDAGRAAALGWFDEESGTQQLIVVAETAVAEEGARGALAAQIAAALVSRESVAASEILLASPRWLQKSTSGKMARIANLERVQAWRVVDDDTLWRWSGRAAPSAATTPAVDRVLDDIDLGVAELISEQLAARGFPVPDTPAELLRVDLLMSGALDSLKFAGLLMYVEVTMNVVLSDDEFAFTERIATGGGIADAVRKARAGPTAGSAARESDHDAKCRLFVEADQDFDLIVIGSSRSMTVRTEAARGRGLTAFNFAVSAPNIEDYAALLRLICAPGRRPPRWLLIELHVDLVPLNAAVTAQLLDCYALAPHLFGVLPPDSELMRASVVGQRGNQSKRRSALILEQLRAGDPAPGRGCSFTPGTGDVWWLGDDAVARAINTNAPLRLPHDTPIERRHLAMKSHGGGAFPVERLGVFKGLLGHLRSLAPTTRALFFEPPEHAQLAGFMATEIPSYSVRRHRLIGWLSSALPDQRSIADARDPRVFEGDPEDFRDAWHMGGHNGFKLTEWLLDRVGVPTA